MGIRLQNGGEMRTECVQYGDVAVNNTLSAAGETGLLFDHLRHQIQAILGGWRTLLVVFTPIRFGNAIFPQPK